MARVLLLALLLGACGPLRCHRVEVGVYPFDGQPRPAGRVVVRCDGTTILEAAAPTLTVGSL